MTFLCNFPQPPTLFPVPGWPSIGGSWTSRQTRTVNFTRGLHWTSSSQSSGHFPWFSHPQLESRPISSPCPLSIANSNVHNQLDLECIHKYSIASDFISLLLRNNVSMMIRAAKITSLVAAVIFTAVFVVIWPGSMLSGENFLSSDILFHLSISQLMFWTWLASEFGQLWAGAGPTLLPPLSSLSLCFRCVDYKIKVSNFFSLAPTGMSVCLSQALKEFLEY